MIIQNDNNKYMLENIIRTLEEQLTRDPKDVFLKSQVIAYKQSYERQYGVVQTGAGK